MIKLVEVLTKEKSNLYPGPWPPEDIYVLVWGRGGGKGGQKDHSWLLPALGPHSYKKTGPASSLYVIVSTDRLPWSQQPQWFGRDDWHSCGVKVYLSETNPLHRHTKGVALEAATFPKLLPDVSLLCNTTLQAFKEWDCHRVSPYGYWAPMVQPHRPAPQCLPAISHTQSWLCQYQPSGCNKGLQRPQQALWHSGHTPGQVKLREKQGKSLLSEFKPHFLRRSMAIEAKRSHL